MVMDGWYFLRKHILLWAPGKGFHQSARIVISFNPEVWIYLLLSGGATGLQTERKGWHLSGCKVNDILSLLMWCRLHKGLISPVTPDRDTKMGQIQGLSSFYTSLLFCFSLIPLFCSNYGSFGFYFKSQWLFFLTPMLQENIKSVNATAFIMFYWHEGKKAKDHSTVALLSITHHFAKVRSYCCLFLCRCEISKQCLKKSI